MLVSAYAIYSFLKNSTEGVWLIGLLIVGLVFIVYVNLPRQIRITDKEAIFEYRMRKPRVVYFKKVLGVNTKGLEMFHGRIVFKGGGWSDILNYK